MATKDSPDNPPQYPEPNPLSELEPQYRAVLKGTIGDKSVQELADLLDSSRQTIYNYISKLKDQGLLETEGDGSAKEYLPTSKSRSISPEITEVEVLGDKGIIIRDALTGTRKRSDTAQELGITDTTVSSRITNLVNDDWLERHESGRHSTEQDSSRQRFVYTGGEALVEELYRINGVDNPDYRQRMLDGIETVFGDSPRSKIGTIELGEQPVFEQMDQSWDALVERLEKEASVDSARQELYKFVKERRAVRQSEIVEYLGCDKTHVSHLISELENTGRITKQKEGRQNIIEFNPEYTDETPMQYATLD